MPWILFFLGGAALAIGAGSSRPKFSVASKGLGLSEIAKIRDLAKLPEWSRPVKNETLAPYRLEDARAIGGVVSKQMAWNATPEALEVFESLGVGFLARDAADVRARAAWLEKATFSSEAVGVAAWLWLVVVRSFEIYGWIGHIRIAEGSETRLFSTSACQCGDLPLGSPPPPDCFCGHSRETLSALAIWATNYAISPATALGVDNRAPAFFIGSSPPAGYRAVGSSGGETLWVDGELAFVDPKGAGSLLDSMARAVVIHYLVLEPYDRTAEGTGEPRLASVPGIVSGLLASGDTQSLVPAQGWAVNALVRSQFLAERAFTVELIDSDPGKWVARGFAIFASVWAAAASAMGLGPFASQISTLAGSLVASAASSVGLSAATAGALVSAATLATKTAISMMVLEILRLTPLGEVFSQSSGDQIVAKAKESIAAKVPLDLAKAFAT